MISKLIKRLITPLCLTACNEIRLQCTAKTQSSYFCTASQGVCMEQCASAIRKSSNVASLVTKFSAVGFAGCGLIQNCDGICRHSLKACAKANALMGDGGHERVIDCKATMEACEDACDNARHLGNTFDCEGKLEVVRWFGDTMKGLLHESVRMGLNYGRDFDDILGAFSEGMTERIAPGGDMYDAGRMVIEKGRDVGNKIVKEGAEMVVAAEEAVRSWLETWTTSRSWHNDAFIKVMKAKKDAERLIDSIPGDKPRSSRPSRPRAPRAARRDNPIDEL